MNNKTRKIIVSALIRRQEQQKLKIQKELDNVAFNVKVKSPEVVLSEISSIDKLVEEVCPTSNTRNVSKHTLKYLDLEEKYSPPDLQEFKEKNEEMEAELISLRKKNALLVEALEFALTFIIHVNLRLTIENVLKVTKE